VSTENDGLFTKKENRKMKNILLYCQPNNENYTAAKQNASLVFLIGLFLVN